MRRREVVCSPDQDQDQDPDPDPDPDQDYGEVFVKLGDGEIMLDGGILPNRSC